MWDRVREEDFLERVISDDVTPCVTLGLNWPEEAAERARAAEATAWAVEARARGEAEARVRELEEQLRLAKKVP